MMFPFLPGRVLAAGEIIGSGASMLALGSDGVGLIDTAAPVGGVRWGPGAPTFRPRPITGTGSSRLRLASWGTGMVTDPAYDDDGLVLLALAEW